MKNAWKQKIVIFLKGWGVSFLIALVIATSFKSAIADWNDVPTGSMIPTILAGDRIFVNKLAYDLKVPYTTWHIAKWSDPRRGEIVVFYSPEDGKRLVKRVVGLPGDTIELREHRLFINGEQVPYEPFEPDNTSVAILLERTRHRLLTEVLADHTHPVMLNPRLPSIASFEPITLAEGKYFMMGDNRDNSSDSRFFGTVDRSLIVGRATTIVLSREDSILHPRWDRFFKKLN